MSVSHPILSRLSLERARAEIIDSQRAIRTACGVTARAFAYPNGGAADYTPAVVDAIVARVGGNEGAVVLPTVTQLLGRPPATFAAWATAHAAAFAPTPKEGAP